MKGSVNSNSNGGIPFGLLYNQGHAKEVKCYPNPFADNLYIECEEDITGIEVYNITGALVWSSKPAAGTRKMSWNGNDKNGIAMATGVYVLKLKTANGTAMCKVQKR